jgi:DNA-binding beta-propeller fold protein YncE
MNPSPKSPAGRPCVPAALFLVAALSGCGASDDDPSGSPGSDAGAGGTAGEDGAGGQAGAGGATICVPVTIAPWDGEGPAFAAPQDLAFAGDRLVVANTGAAWDADAMALVFGEGFLTVIDPASGAVVNRIPTRAPNPQKVAVHGDRLFVVNTGPTAYDGESGEVHATGDGSLDALPVAALDTATAFAQSVALPAVPAAPRLGAPLDLAFAGDRGYLTSSTANAIYIYDATSGTLERGPDDPVWLGAPDGVGLGTIAAHGDHLYVVDFNTDTLWRVRAADGTVSPCGVAVGQAADLEGAQNPRIVGDDLYVMLVIAGSIERRSIASVDAAFENGCPAVPADAAIAPLGQFPNDFEMHDGVPYVVNSGDNRVVAYADDGDPIETFDLAVGANPWAVAFSADGRYMAVSEQGGQGVTVFDRTCDDTWRQGLAP